MNQRVKPTVIFSLSMLVMACQSVTHNPPTTDALSNTPVPTPALPAPIMAEAVVKAPAMQARALSAMPIMMPAIAMPEAISQDREKYHKLDQNPVQKVSDAPVSTFSIDVDTGSYSNVRRFLNDGRLPPVGAVRTEEIVNYFDYSYPQPSGNQPFAVTTQSYDSPFHPNAKLIKIAIQAKEQQMSELPAANLVFLVDVSGSMASDNKLGLVKKTLRTLVHKLRAKDTVTIITYASGETIALEPTAGDQKQKILDVINRLQAQGATSGERAISLAYQSAERSYVKDGINRILLATDGDFNVGVTDFDTLKGMVSEKRKSGISLSTLGYGTGNYNEHLMEQLADAGDGNYSYIDNEKEAAKVIDRQLSSTLATVAKDVKIQVEFNPNTVKEYRLIGYENRMLNEADFNNDKVDAGDIGAGHQMTAFYEIIPVGVQGWLDDTRYQTQPSAVNTQAREYAYLQLRYKQANASADDDSLLIQAPILADAKPFGMADTDTKFAVSATGFGEALRGGKYLGKMDWAQIETLAQQNIGTDPHGLRQEFVELIGIAKSLSTKPAQVPSSQAD
ncbi:vWA domain-containing protein [Moraxella pluranimalium]|uniref:VWFA domain-containing protein n=1 Tax=Moraxella pluranimalium TaxID=470453 RepID=A0A1T0CS27_9GAMM|nr:VWA domain-containing protein [Moraxella pluranimalium]OOS25140.1 hypothetical protein B0680_03320 [Moraxella pluranimalium]